MKEKWFIVERSEFREDILERHPEVTHIVETDGFEYYLCYSKEEAEARLKLGLKFLENMEELDLKFHKDRQS